MENENFGQKVQRKTISILKKTLIILVVVGIAVFAFLYWATFENGVMAGKVLRLSEKGVIFKTYEGKSKKAVRQISSGVSILTNPTVS